MTRSNDQYAAMERLAQKQGISMRDYLWQAMELVRTMVTVKADGEKIIFRMATPTKN